uniref:Uncharacterized protein n=1 Tax=Arundo donax TaxID=35708 RepID=A0A0A8XTG4_ARUDO
MRGRGNIGAHPVLFPCWPACDAGWRGLAVRWGSRGSARLEQRCCGAGARARASMATAARVVGVDCVVVLGIDGGGSEEAGHRSTAAAGEEARRGGDLGAEG